MDTHIALAPTAPVRIALIVGSVRANRFADALVPWLVRAATLDGAVDLDLIDLADVDLPPDGPDSAAVSPIAGRLSDADAFLVLTPEYNHSFPAALKNAVDWHFDEWARKPVGFVAYGAGSGGVRAVEQLIQVFRELRSAPIRDSVLLSAPWTRVDDAGVYVPSDAENAALSATVTEVCWWADALRAKRANDDARVAS